jgi:membrane-bound serine protease (ClpP class)
LAGRYLPQTSVFHRLILDDSTSRSEGYTASKETSQLVGLEGVTLTPLFPAGSAMIGDDRVDVITRGEFVEVNQAVRVVETHGNRIIVEAI